MLGGLVSTSVTLESYHFVTSIYSVPGLSLSSSYRSPHYLSILPVTFHTTVVVTLDPVSAFL